MSGFEALVRLRSADGELIAPDRFIPLAERNGLIHQLTELVFNQAIGWFSDYLGATPYILALNTSPSVLADKQFPQR